MAVSRARNGRVVAVGAVVGLVAVVAVVGQGGVAGAQEAVNPLMPVAPGDVYADPSHGFLVLIEQDAELNENETEGPMAIGGDVRFRDYRAGLNNPGSYVLSGDTRPTSLVIGGRADFAGSRPGGSLTTLNNSYAKIGDLSNADALTTGGVTYVVPNGGNTNTRPAVIVNTAQPGASVAGPSGFDFASLFATYREISAEMFACPATVGLYDQNSQEPWNGTDPTATIGLQPGQNVLNLTGDQLATLQNINPRSSGPQPGDTAWLIVNVNVTGDYTFTPPNVSWQGNDSSRHVLWNFTTSGTITLPQASPTVWGTFYAPNAELIDLSSANIEGAVVTRTAFLGDTNAGDGGEIHSAPFEHIVTTCGTTPPTTTTEPTTTTAPTTEPTTPTTTDSTPVPTSPTGGASGGELPATGTSAGPFLILGGLLVAAGAAAVVVARRRGKPAK